MAEKPVCPLCLYAYGMEEPRQEPPFAVSRNFYAIVDPQNGSIKVFYKQHDFMKFLKDEDLKQEFAQFMNTVISKNEKLAKEKDPGCELAYQLLVFFDNAATPEMELSHGFFVLYPVKDNGCGGCGGGCGGCDGGCKH